MNDLMDTLDDLIFNYPKQQRDMLIASLPILALAGVGVLAAPVREVVKKSNGPKSYYDLYVPLLQQSYEVETPS